MKNGIKYLALIGALLFVGAGCGQTVRPPADDGAGKPAAQQPKPSAQKDDLDKAIDDILDGATGEAGLEEEAAKDAAEIDADKTELNSLKDATYEAQ